MRIILAVLIMICASCTSPDPKVQMEKLDGYWEIESVALPNGSIKEYSISAVVDFIEVLDSSGVRTKVNPQLDGSFKNNGVAEKFTLAIEDDSLRMHYKTPFDSWKETVLVATDSILRVKNQDGKVYNYHKFKKYDFTP